MAPPIALSPAQQPASEAEPAASGARTEGTAKEAVVEDGAEEESLEGLDEFLREMKEQANVDSEKTVVINAPRSLVSEENEFLLEARSRTHATWSACLPIRALESRISRCAQSTLC